MVVFVVVVISPEGHVLRRNLGYHTRGHHVVGMDRIETHQIAEDLILILIDHAFLFADAYHRQHLFAADGGFIFVVGEHARDEFDQEDERIEDIDERVDRTSGEAHQFAPIGCTDHLRDDLAEDQDEQGHASRDESEPFRTEDLRSLHADAGSTDRVGNRVQR